MKGSRRRGLPAAVIVASVMVGVAVLSLLLIGIYNYWSARNLISDTVETRIVEVGSARIARVGQGMSSLAEGTATLAADPFVVASLDELASGFRELGQDVTPAEEQELRSAYEREITALVPEGVEVPPIDELLPTTSQGRRLQLLYMARNPEPVDGRRNLTDAGDGSSYSRVHAARHPALRALAEKTGMRDLLLIESSTSTVVWSLDKRVDVGTSLATGPYRDSNLAEAVIRRLRTAAAGETVVVDFERYQPSGGRPTAFMAAAVRDQGRLVGALAVEIPSDNLVAIVSDGTGEDLGETGEVYVVGSDLLMRSESRLWLEDEAAYLAALDETGAGEVGDEVATWGSAVLAQPVDTEPVAAALDGDRFAGPAVNYLGIPTFSVAVALDLPGVEWVAVGEVSRAEVFVTLDRYRDRILLVAAILIPLVLVAGIVLTRRMLRPLGPIEEAARRIGDGDFEVVLPGIGRDEFDDLERRMNDTVQDLRLRKDELIRSELETDELLLAVLPRRFLDHVKDGDTTIAESMRDATLIAISNEGHTGGTMDEDTLVEVDVSLSGQIAELAERLGIEHFHTSTTHRLYAAGLATDGTEAGSAVEFADGVRELCRRIGEERHVAIPFRAGLAAGNVVAGLVGTERLAFDVWGPPLRQAMTLVAVAGDGDILVDETVAAGVPPPWRAERASSLVDLNGDEIAGWRVEEAGAAG